MPLFEVEITITVTAHTVEATSQEEADQIVLDDAKTRFPPDNVDVTEHSCN